MGENIQIVKTITDKQDSVEVNKNSKGEIQYAIKVYCNTEDLDATYLKIKALQNKIEIDNKR